MAILDLTLRTGRPIWAPEIHMRSTYAGMLEGYPTAEMNVRTIAGLPQWAMRLFGDWPVHLIEPSRTYPETKDPWLGPPEYLPAICVAGEFQSLPIGDDAASALILIWFQESPFPVPSEYVITQLQNVDWENLACDYCP